MSIYILQIKQYMQQQQRQRQYSANQSIPKNSPQHPHYTTKPQQPQQFQHLQPHKNPPQQSQLISKSSQIHIQQPLNTPLITKIHQQISQIQQINHQLITISQKIKVINTLNSKQTSIPIIQKIKIDFSHALNQLIQNIMQFHTDIDVKLINLGHFVQKQFNKNKIGWNNSPGLNKNIIGNVQNPNIGLTQNQINTIIQQSTDAKYQILAQRIRGLQVSLRQTQLNQKKLIQVIQNMMQRYQINDQPTLIRQSPTLQNQFQRNRINTTHTNSNNSINYNKQQRVQFKKNTVPVNNTILKPQNKNKSIYQNLYTIEQSLVNQQIQPQSYYTNKQQKPQHFRLRQIQQQQQTEGQIYIKKLYSKYPTNVNPSQNKRSLRGQSQHTNINGSLMHNSINKQKSTASQSSIHDDKQHRLNFMMGKLIM